MTGEQFCPVCGWRAWPGVFTLRDHIREKHPPHRTRIKHFPLRKLDVFVHLFKRIASLPRRSD